MSGDDVQRYQGMFAQLDMDRDGYVLVSSPPSRSMLQGWVNTFRKSRAGSDTACIPMFCTAFDVVTSTLPHGTIASKCHHMLSG